MRACAALALVAALSASASALRLDAPRSRLGAARRAARAAPSLSGAGGASGGCLAFLQAKGVDTAALSAREADGRLVCARDVRPGETLLSVPAELHLSEQSLRANVVGSFIDGWPMEAGEHAAIALALLHELFLQGDSRLAGYVAALPQPGSAELDLPLLWSADEQRELAESTTLPFSASVAAVEADFAWLQQSAFGAAPDLFPAEVFSAERFRWAYAIALSRAVRLDDALALVPGLSEVGRVLGGAAAGRVEVARRQGGGLFGPKTAAAVLLAKEGAISGDALAIGIDATPSELLEAQGLLPERVPAECELRLRVEAADPLAEDKGAVLQGAGLSASQLWTLRAGKLSRDDLLKYMRVVALEGADAFILEAVFLNDCWEYHLDQPFSPNNEDAAIDRTIATCEAALGAIRGDDDADAAAAAAADGSRAARMAQLRIAERAALRDTLAWFRAERELNPSKEYYQERRLRELNLDRPVDPDEIVPG